MPISKGYLNYIRVNRYGQADLISGTFTKDEWDKLIEIVVDRERTNSDADHLLAILTQASLHGFTYHKEIKS